jgi:hypothetical protein
MGLAYTRNPLSARAKTAGGIIFDEDGGLRMEDGKKENRDSRRFAS